MIFGKDAYNFPCLDTIYSEQILKLTIITHLCFVFLLPWTVLTATIDRCISLRLPTYYAAFNGENVRLVAVVIAMGVVFLTWYWIFRLVVHVDSYGCKSIAHLNDPISMF
jgi:hypothetical protein